MLTSEYLSIILGLSIAPFFLIDEPVENSLLCFFLTGVCFEGLGRSGSVSGKQYLLCYVIKNWHMFKYCQMNRENRVNRLIFKKCNKPCSLSVSSMISSSSSSLSSSAIIWAGLTSAFVFAARFILMAVSYKGDCFCGRLRFPVSSASRGSDILRFNVSFSFRIYNNIYEPKIMF